MARQEWVWCAQVSILIKNKHQVPEASYPEIPSTGCEAALHNAQLSRPSPAADTLQGGPGSAALEPVLSSCFWTSAVQGMQHTLLELSCFNPSPLRDFLSEGNTIILRKFGTEVDPAISLSSSAWRSPEGLILEAGWGLQPLEGDIGPAKAGLRGSGAGGEFLDPFPFPPATHTPTETLIPRKPYKIGVTRDREMDSVRLLKLPVLLF